MCYSDRARCKLTCGHVFCKSCVKAWYQKGTGEGCSSCPMCRRPIYFKGLYKLRRQWDEESYEARANEVFNEALDSMIDGEIGSRSQSFSEYMEYMAPLAQAALAELGIISNSDGDLALEAEAETEDGREAAQHVAELVEQIHAAFREERRSSRGPLYLRDLRDLEETYRCLKHEEAHPDEIDYVLTETDECLSSRRLNCKKQGRERWRILPQPKLINKAPRHKRQGNGSRIGIRLGR